MSKLVLSVLAVTALFSALVSAQTSAEIDAFIVQHGVPTYDCPQSDHIPALEDYLNSDMTSDDDRRALRVEKTHWQICMGKYEDAKVELESLINDLSFDRTTRAFASAIYQVGFLWDVREDDKRCGYYSQALELAKDKFSDIELSAELGLITVCGSEGGPAESEKLGRLYAMLERYSDRGDRREIAHLYNNIGLLYGSLGQHVLAAEQYKKSYEMGLGVYQSSNVMSQLISVVSSQFASGNYEGARDTIDEMKRMNLEVNTPLSNVWVHFAESGYYYRTGDFENLRDSLARWQVFQAQISSSMYDGLFRWYSAALCLHDEDSECLVRFVEGEKGQYKSFSRVASGNKEYLKLMTDIQFFLGNLDQAKRRFDIFTELVYRKIGIQQSSGRVLGVASLYAQITQLEESLEQARRQRMLTVTALTVLTLCAAIVGVVFVRHRQLSQRSRDPLTGLLNTRAVINDIKRINKPSAGLTNALALFDLDNFKDMNNQFGNITWDVALQQIAMTLKKVTRDQDVIGRLGADQFVVCLTNIEESTARAFFGRMQSALEDTVKRQEGEEKINLNSSMTIYVETGGFADVEDILKDMQIALQSQVAHGI